MLALLFFHGNQMWGECRAAFTSTTTTSRSPLHHLLYPPLPSSAGPNFWKFAAFPLTLYIIEKAIRIRNAGHHAELKCLEVKKLADKVTRAAGGCLPRVTPYLTPRIPYR